MLTVAPYRHALPYLHMQRWDRFFLAQAFFVSGKSKDQSTQCGCVIASVDHDILSIGWNDLPRRVDDKLPERRQRPMKYLWTEHAERNAIYNAGRKGVSLLESVLYVTRFPCPDCARAIIQSGISKVVSLHYPDEQDWSARANCSVSDTMLNEAGVMVSLYPSSEASDLIRYDEGVIR